MKKFRPFYLIFLLFFTFTTLKVTTTINAQTETLVNSIDGASIRIKTENSEQGLRFYAKLDESVKNNEHGFYLIFGNATVEELKLAISLKSDNEIILNGKPVFKVVVPSVRSDNTYSVVLTGIPEAGYFDFLSVIPYVVYDDNEIYAKPNSRSIASVILKMSNEGEDVSNVVSIDKIIKTDRRRIIEHKNGDIEIVNSIYEEDKENLKLEFLKDFNAEQDFWSSPYTGNLRLSQYFTNVKPGDAWSDADMAKLPTGLSASVSIMNITQIVRLLAYQLQLEAVLPLKVGIQQTQVEQKFHQSLKAKQVIKYFMQDGKK